MNIFAQSLGLLIENDQVSLSEGLLVTNSYLVDEIAGAKHCISPKARDILEIIMVENQVSTIVNLINDNFINKSDFIEVIIFLNSIGGLKVRRNRVQTILASSTKLAYRLQGIRLKTSASRYKASIISLLKIVLQTMAPICLVTVINVLLLIGSGLNSLPLIKSQILFVLCLFISTVLHEGAHVYVAKRAKSPAILVKRGMRIGVLHKNLSTRNELVSAVAGPLIGIYSILIIVFVLKLFGASSLEICMVSVITLFHALSWLPVYGDGAAIINNFRSWYASEA